MTADPTGARCLDSAVLIDGVRHRCTLPAGHDANHRDGAREWYYIDAASNRGARSFPVPAESRAPRAAAPDEPQCGIVSKSIFPGGVDRYCVRPSGHIGRHTDGECWWGMAAHAGWKDEIAYQDATAREIASLRARLAALEAERERLLRFAGEALTDARLDEIGDWDGGAMQDALESCGLIECVRRSVPCGENCPCMELYDEGDTASCYPITPLGHAAVAAYREAENAELRQRLAAHPDTTETV